MSEVMPFSSLDAHWHQRAGQVAQLFASVPVAPGACILTMLGQSSAQTAVLWACAQAQVQAVVMPADAAQQAVAQVIAQHQPSVVVCASGVFGWVSKLAFVAGTAAVYTCGEAQEGTLLDRAVHFDIKSHALPPHTMPSVLRYDAKGVAQA